MSPDALRMLDANLNRAREALRTVEDYARFALDDGELCGRLKAIRHDLATATGELAADAVLWRDTPGDVGTTITTADERRRHDLGSAVVAAGKRFGEAGAGGGGTAKNRRPPTPRRRWSKCDTAFTKSNAALP